MEDEAATTSSSSPPRRRSTEPWLWIIEYLSIFPQIPASLLHDVIEAAPQMPDEDGKTTTEMVALRCLEDLFTRDDDPTTHSPPRGTPTPPPPFDPSLTCDAALQAIFQSKSLEELHEGGAGILGWDIRPFVRRKRASMSKCTLELLRDGALGVGSRLPCITSLVEATHVLRDDGMRDTEPVHSDDRNISPPRNDKRGSDSPHVVETEGDTVHVTPEKEDVAAGDDLSDENLLLSAKRMNSLVDKEAVDSGGENLSLPKSDDGEHGSPRAPLTEERDVLRSNGNENGIEPDYLDRGNALPAKRDRSPSMDREQDISDVVHDCRSKVKRLRPDLSCTTPFMQQVVLPPHLLQLVNEVSGRMAADAGDKYLDLENACQIDGLPPAKGIVSLERGHEDCLDISRPRKAPDSDADPDANHKIEHDQNHKRHASTMAEDSSSDEEEGSMEHNYAEDTSCDTDDYHHLRIDVAKVKDRFLSSRFTSSDDHLATADWKEDNLCTMCNLDGQLLICSTVGCPLVVHENCLGSSPKYMSGNFYCPFCAYSLAISKLEEALKKASLARKKLTAFIHAKPPSKGCSERLNVKDDGSSRRNQKEGPLHDIDNNRHLEDGRELEGNPCTVDDRHSKKRKGNLQRVGPPQSCSDATLLDGGPKPTATSPDNSVKKKGRERVIPEESVVELGRQEDCIQVEPKSSDNALGEDNRIPLLKKRRPDKEACSEVSDQEAAELLNFLARGADDVNDNSNHSRRSQSRGKRCSYTYPALPQLKRKRVPWTAQEEEMLKEGVQKFSNASEAMPWRMILDYGSSVFWKGRNPVDLKDKWRNMCKAKG